MPGYVLVVAKNGPKLKKPADINRSECGDWTQAAGPNDGGNQICRKQQVTGDRTESILMMTNSAYGPWQSSTSHDAGSDKRQWHDEYFRTTMPQLAEALTSKIAPGSSLGLGGELGPTSPYGTSVVNGTGIDGAWDVVTGWGH